MRLRSLLLNESPESLAALAPPEKWDLGRSTDGTAFCLSFLRASLPVLGLERAVTEGFPGLTLEVSAGGQSAFPVLSWRGFAPPLKAKELPAPGRWSFGQITVPGLSPARIEARRLNWNTMAYVIL